MRIILQVRGFSCAADAVTLERAIRRQPGVRAASVNPVSETAAVEIDRAATTPALVLDAVRRRGYEARLAETIDAAGRAADAPPTRDQRARPLVIVCVDGSEVSATIVPVARRLADRLGADVHLARVVDRRTVHEPAAAALEALAHGFPAEVRTVLLHGPSAAEAIVSYACAQDADLIAMATHSRGAVAELIWGSTTAAVVRSGVAPVVVIHPVV